jgi:hypothetical protein
MNSKLSLNCSQIAVKGSEGLIAIALNRRRSLLFELKKGTKLKLSFDARIQGLLRKILNDFHAFIQIPNDYTIIGELFCSAC